MEKQKLGPTSIVFLSLAGLCGLCSFGTETIFQEMSWTLFGILLVLGAIAFKR